MKKGTILLFTPSFAFKNIHFFKDVVIVPEIISREFDLNFSILTRKNEDHYSQKPGIQIALSKNIFQDLWYFWKLRPEVIMMFHLHPLTLAYVLLFKIIHRKTKIYIKMDGEYILDIYSRLLRYVAQLFFLLVDVVSIESKKGLNHLQNRYIKNGNKFFYLPNGYDPEQYPTYTYNEEYKEKIIITVGRLGTYQKNTELLLKILGEVLFIHPEYRAHLIGPIEKDFQPFIESYFLQNPDLQNKIIFTGPITEREELFEYYKKSQFFLLSSRFDITPNVYAESGYFGNIIVTTEVGGALDITASNTIGYVFDENKPTDAVKYIGSLIDSNEINRVGKKSTEYIHDEFNYIPRIRNIYQYLFKN